jgi:hypothetical protein
MCSFLLMISHASHGLSFSGKNQRSFNTSKISNHLLKHSQERRSNPSKQIMGGEYVNHEIQNIFLEAGIQLQQTVPYTLQQNGVAEQKNRSLKEIASCMIHAKSVPWILWDEELNCETYIQNISPHIFFKDKTPDEALSGLKPEVTHFRIFDSCAWARIPSEKKKALDPQITECVFVGYPTHLSLLGSTHP